MVATILRLPSVRARTGLARSTIYLRIAEGTFPRPINLGARCIFRTNVTGDSGRT